jgi:hypothetical protein
LAQRNLPAKNTLAAADAKVVEERFRARLYPHHLTLTQSRALGRRVSDEFIVPVCRVHLHHDVAHIAELGLAPICLAIELGFWIGGRGLGVILALVAVEI